MKTNLLRNTFATIAALFISMFALPQQAQAEDYNLKIAGVQVTSANCNDLSDIDGVTGTVKYNPNTKTLTLDNATINATGDNDGIYGKIDGLTVEVKGTVNVTAQSSALNFQSSATLTGDGTLNATSGDCGIYAETDLTLDGLTVNAKGKWGITGYDGSVERLTIRNATVTAEGTEGSIDAWKTLTLDGCAITQPAGAAFDESLKGVALNGQLVKEKVTISPLSASGFTVIDGVKKPILSHEYFDEGDNVFVLRFNLSADGKEIVQIDGNRNLHTGKDIDLTKKESEHDEWYWAVTYATGFIGWGNCHRVFTGYGDPDSDSPVFTTGTLRIDGDPGTFTVSLKNGRITADTAWGDGKTHTVSIKYGNDPTGIDTVTSDASVKKQGIYNLQGVKLNTAFDRLPAGIYIVDGKKVVKK